MFPFLYRLSFFEAKKFASYWRIFERWIYPKKYLLEMRRIITLEICGIYRKKPLVQPLMQHTENTALSGIFERPRVAR